MRLFHFVIILVLSIGCGNSEPKKGNNANNANNVNNVNNANNANNVNNANNFACTADADCGVDQACSIGACVTPCSLNADCPTGEVCKDAIDGPVAQLCAPVGPCSLDSECLAGDVCEENECVPTCVSDAECLNGATCQARPANGSVCKQGGVTGSTYDFFVIGDLTQGESCQFGDPGSDLQYVRISENDSTVGYALLREVMFGSGPNDFTDTAILDGNPPPYVGDCTDNFTDVSIVAMGCGGEFLFQAIGIDGLPFSLGTEHAITVGEYGLQCGGGTDDRYEVLGCTNGLDRSECITLWGNGSGIASFDVL